MLVSTQSEGNADQTKVEDDIINYITTHPGVHFNDMLRGLGIAAGTLQYHLNRMETKKEIIVLRKEYKTLYFPVSLKDPVDRKILVFLRQQIPRTMLLILIEHPDKTGHELTKLLKITKSTLSYYTKRLGELDIIKIKVEGREKHYSVTHPGRIAKLLTEHKKSFSDEMVDRFVDIWVRI
jgi:predicted transcriptional regulator